MTLNLGPYSKAITGIVTHALVFASMYYGTNHYVSAAIAVAGALGIYAVPNQSKDLSK